MNGRIVNLEVNDSGAWRRVSSFDLDTFEEGQLEYAAQQLLELSNHKKGFPEYLVENAEAG